MPSPGVVLEVLHDISEDNQKTDAFQIPQWARTGKVLLPDLESNAAVTMEVILPEDVSAASDLYPNSDTNWKTVYDSAESNQVAASGVEDCWVDITEYIRGFPSGTYGRFVAGGAQAADRTYKVAFGGK